MHGCLCPPTVSTYSVELSLRSKETVGLQTEAMTPDPWLGLLREPKNTGKVLGPTLEAIVVEHFSRVLFGPHGNFFLSFNSGGQDLRRKAWPLLGACL